VLVRRRNARVALEKHAWHGICIACRTRASEIVMMERRPARCSPLLWGCIAAAALAAGGCAGGPSERPDTAIARAEASINAAERAGGRQYGAADLDMAREKLTRSKMMAEQGEEVSALRLAEQASVDANLAGAKAVSGKSREALEQLRASNQALREEAMRPDTRGSGMPEQEGQP
jgi:hypothetical protein